MIRSASVRQRKLRLVITLQPMHGVLHTLHWEIAFEKCSKYAILILMKYY